MNYFSVLFGLDRGIRDPGIGIRDSVTKGIPNPQSPIPACPAGWPTPQFLIIISAILALTSFPASAAITDPSIDNCRFAVDEAIAKETRLYRTVLFGRPRASQASISTVWHDNNGRAWYKIGKNKWERIGISPDETETATDEIMEFIAETDSLPIADGGMVFQSDASDPKAPLRRGIFYTKRMLTSDLLPYITQAFRSFSCRLDTVCELARKSVNVEQTGEFSSQQIEIMEPGCIKATLGTYPACHFAGAKGSNLQVADVFQYCEKIKNTVLLREAEMMKMFVEYDAAYRSLLQFAGIFENFLLEFKQTLSGNIRDASYVIGWLNKIPCFISSCDVPVPPGGINDDD